MAGGDVESDIKPLVSIMPQEFNIYIKRQLNEAMNMTFETAFDYAIRLQYQCIHTEDHKEAVNVFLKKKKIGF